MKVKAIGFDWDGTLINSMPAKAVVFAECVIGKYPQLRHKKGELARIYLETAGTPLRLQYQKAFVLCGLDPASKESVQAIEELYTLFFDKTEGMYTPLKSPIFPDVVAALSALKNSGHTLFVSSSVTQEQLEIILPRYIRLAGLFEFVLGEKPEFSKGKAHLEEAARRLGVTLGEIVFVGDGVGDVKAARESEVSVIGVIRRGNGSKSEEKLREAKPDALIASLAELEPELGKLGVRG